MIPQGTIVVGVDGSPSAARALDWAIAQAVREHRPLTLAHAVDPQAARVVLLSDPTATLQHARASAAELAPDLAVHEVTSTDDPRVLLLDLAERAALVVIGSRGRGPLQSLLLGSVGMALTRHATCPVVVVRPGSPGIVRNGVLVGADGTERSLAALEFAYRQASLCRRPLTVIHCVGPTWTVGVDDEARLTVAETLSGFTEKFPDVRTRIELAGGFAGDTIVRASRRTELVVLGAHHGSALGSGLIGSVASSVVEHATCPVAIVPTHTQLPHEREDQAHR